MDAPLQPYPTASQWEELSTDYIQEASYRDTFTGYRIAELDIGAAETGILDLGTADRAFLIALWKKLHHQNIRVKLVGVDFCTQMITKANAALRHEAQTNPCITADIAFLVADIKDIGTDTTAGRSVQQDILCAAPDGISTITCFEVTSFEDRKQYNTHRAQFLNMFTARGRVIWGTSVPHFSWRMFLRKEADNTSTMLTLVNLGTQAVVNDFRNPWSKAARQNNDPLPVLEWKALARFVGNHRTKLPVGARMINSRTAVTATGAVIYVSSTPLRMMDYNAQYFKYLAECAATNASYKNLGQQMQDPSMKKIKFDTLSSKDWALLDNRFGGERQPPTFHRWLESIDPHIYTGADHSWYRTPSIIITWVKADSRVQTGSAGQGDPVHAHL